MKRPADTPKPLLDEYFRSWQDPMPPDQVRGIREHILGLTQHELAALLDVSPTTISRWENADDFKYPQCRSTMARMMWLCANYPDVVRSLSLMNEPTPTTATPPTFDFDQYKKP